MDSSDLNTLISDIDVSRGDCIWLVIDDSIISEVEIKFIDDMIG